jgi:hypothetical protein
VSGHPPDDGVVAARQVAASGVLDLDDIRAEIGQVPGAEWPRDGLLQRDDADTAQGKRRISR